MRTSLFLMLCADAANAFAVIRPSLKNHLRWLRYTNTYTNTSSANITDEEYLRLKRAILAAATEPLTLDFCLRGTPPRLFT